MTAALRRGLFFLQMPPPVHGVSVVNASVIADEQVRCRVTIDLLKADYSERLAEIGKISVTKGLRWVALLFRFVWRLRWRRTDFVYCTPVPTGIGFLRDVPFVLLGKILCRRTILHLHGRGIAECVSKSRLWHRLYRATFGGCAIISASRDMQRIELDPLQLKGSRLYVIPNAVERVDVERFRMPRTRDDPPRVLFLSATVPSKGIFVLLNALDQLVRERTPFRLEIVGSSTPEWECEVADRIERSDLKKSVAFRGALFGKEKYAALGRADLFVHPTQNDYFPLVLLEAMQFGLPIVTTRVGAIPEIVDERTGIIVPPNDVEALGHALRSMLLDEARRDSCGAAGRRRYLDRYVPERFTRDLLAVFAAEEVA